MEHELTRMELDSEQESVAFVDPQTRQVVIAGPGSGKTQVVSSLVENLVLDEGIEPAHGLLVLSLGLPRVWLTPDL